MNFTSVVRKFMRKAGFDIVRFDFLTNPIARRLHLMTRYKINLIFDVGANIGQFANAMRKNGYTGRIVSFEPLSSAFARLKEKAKNDDLWECVNIGLGNYEGKAIINIAGNSQSSSILDILPAHLQAAPESCYIGKEEIMITTVDSIINRYYHDGDKAFLKIDTQGYERYVLEGIQSSHDPIIGIQLEMSFEPLYEGELLFSNMIDYMSAKGFTLMSIEPILTNPKTGQLLQVDGIFFRRFR